MNSMDASVPHGIASRASGLSPDVQRQQTFTFGVNKNQRIPSRDQTQVTHFAKLWQDRLLARKTLSQKKFQVERVLNVLSHVTGLAIKAYKRHFYCCYNFEYPTNSFRKLFV